mmetsp:Transcript_73755/g.187041  ORF Transcript_73755/g.187041 Transcript_73755/m.187041 type:complete len:254 (+) Transcript_73755:616-1377(+)
MHAERLSSCISELRVAENASSGSCLREILRRDDSEAETRRAELLAHGGRGGREACNRRLLRILETGATAGCIAELGGVPAGLHPSRETSHHRRIGPSHAVDGVLRVEQGVAQRELRREARRGVPQLPGPREAGRRAGPGRVDALARSAGTFAEGWQGGRGSLPLRLVASIAAAWLVEPHIHATVLRALLLAADDAGALLQPKLANSVYRCCKLAGEVACGSVARALLDVHDFGSKAMDHLPSRGCALVETDGS